MKLTTSKIAQLTKPGRYAYGNGLHLLVSKGGSKSWILRVPVNGKRTDKGLGGWPKVSLAQAVRKVDEMLQSVEATGRLPARGERRGGLTFAEVAQEVYETYGPSWTGKYARNWIQSLEDYVYPDIGDLYVDSITSKQLLEILKPIWHVKPETARRIRQRLKKVYEWAIDYEYCHSNPATSLKSLPNNTTGKKHFKSLPYAELPTFIEALDKSPGSDSVKGAIRFLILCASRNSEARLATWQEIDLVDREWRIPAERMKSGNEHRVPLSAAAMDLLTQTGQKEEGFIFPSPICLDAAMSDMTMTMLVRRLGFDITIHGFRATFKTWAMEQTETPWAVGELALAHSLGDSTVQAYARSDLFEARRRLMQEWSDYVEMGKIGVKLAA